MVVHVAGAHKHEFMLSVIGNSSSPVSVLAASQQGLFLPRGFRGAVLFIQHRDTFLNK